MTCAEVRSILGDAVDGELPGDAIRALEEHAGACPDCRRRLQFERRLKQLVARRARPPAPPSYLPEHVRRTVLGAVPGRRRPSRWAAASLAAVVLAAAAWSILPRPGTEQGLAAALAADHAEFLARTDAAHVVSADPAAIEAWFRGRLPFDPKLPALRARLRGARVCSILGRPCALVFCEAEGRAVSLFAFAGSAFRGPMPPAAREGALSVVGWEGDRQRYALVSDLAPESLALLAGDRGGPR